MIGSTLINSNILIVDDQIANIDILESYLEMQGYTNIKSTTDPRKVVELISTFGPDLILLDLTMPFLTGFEVMEQLKPLLADRVSLPILVLTADVTNETKQKALSGGASDFLTKPFDLIEVGLRIRNLLFSSYLLHQSKNQNQILEEKVRERTHELEKMNTELILARNKAESSDRLKTAFMNNISHEVRTPLNGILGYGSLLAEPGLKAEDKLEYVSMLKASSNRLVNTITDYMDISLIASGNVDVEVKTVDIIQVLNEAKGKFEDICNARKLTFSLVVPGNQSKYMIQTDDSLLQKIVSHLIDNAIKFTHRGAITAGYQLKTDKVEFFVKDTGIGIDKEAKELIFDIFMQENSADTRGHEGSGLGLSIISGFLKLLGGEIRFESVKGEGTTFYFSLPHAQVLPHIEDPTKVNSLPTPLTGPVILIAEDDDLNMFYMVSILKKSASLIFKAANGREAVDLCREHPEIEIVIMDMKMPVMNGMDATREIKAFRKNIPIIAVTAYAMSEDKKRVFEAGCDDFLTKPASKADLLAKIREFGFAV